MVEIRDLAEIVEESDIIRFLKSSSNPTRYKILCVLMQGELSVTNIGNRIGVDHNLVTQHLSILKDAELVTSSKSGNYVIYFARKEHVRAMVEKMTKQFLVE